MLLWLACAIGAGAVTPRLLVSLVLWPSGPCQPGLAPPRAQVDWAAVLVDAAV